MNISEYRLKHGLTRKDAGDLFGVSAEFIRLCEIGQRKLSPDRAREIETVTGGEISKSDLRPDIWQTEAA